MNFWIIKKSHAASNILKLLIQTKPILPCFQMEFLMNRIALGLPAVLGFTEQSVVLLALLKALSHLGLRSCLEQMIESIKCHISLILAVFELEKSWIYQFGVEFGAEYVKMVGIHLSATFDLDASCAKALFPCQMSENFPNFNNLKCILLFHARN